MRVLLISLLFMCLNLHALEVEELSIKTARGVTLKAKLHLPETINAETPVLVIGSGQGYHMELPLVKGLAEKAASEGMISFRFNWDYFNQGGKTPSKDLVNEVQDMDAVLNFAKKKYASSKRKFLLAGKSLGTMVSYRIYRKHSDLFGLYLLTPVCTRYWDENGNRVEPFPVGKESYPEFLKESRPIHFTLGNKDPLCNIGMLYEFSKESKGNVSMSIFGGDHGMNIGKWNDPVFKERNAANIKMGIDSTVHWMKVHLGR